MDTPARWRSALRNLQRASSLLRHDAEALESCRHLALGLALCLTVGYAAHTLLVEEPRQQLQKLLTKKEEVRAPAAAVETLSDRLAQLEEELHRVEERIAVLETREEYTREQWQTLADADRFTQTVFTLLPAAPLRFAEAITQMEMGEATVRDGFSVHPATLTGETDFTDFIRYLRYLEGQPVVGLLEDLSLERLKDTENRLRFTLRVGRTTLKEESQ